MATVKIPRSSAIEVLREGNHTVFECNDLGHRTPVRTIDELNALGTSELRNREIHYEMDV